MPPKTFPEKASMIAKIYKHFEAESKRKAPFFSWDKIYKRTCHALGISKALLHSCLKTVDATSESENAANRKTRKDSLDGFSKDLIKRVVLSLMDKNENITLCKLRQHLKDNNDLCVGKFKLWKTLHHLGFRYRKVDGNRRVLTERHDIVNQRINFLRKIRSRREEGSTVVYLDETWIDSHHYPSYQWAPPDPSQQKKLPINKGDRLYNALKQTLFISYRVWRGHVMRKPV